MQTQQRTPLQRTSGVLSIISGSFQLLGGLLMVLAIGFIRSFIEDDLVLTDAQSSAVDSALTWLMIISLILAGVGLAMIIFGSMFCKTKRRVVTPIVLMVLTLVPVILGFILTRQLDIAMEHADGYEGSTGLGVFWLDWIFAALIVVPAILHLAMGNKVYGNQPQVAAPQQPVQPQ